MSITGKFDINLQQMFRTNYKKFVSTYRIIPRNHNRFYTTKQSNLYVIVSKEEMLCDSQVEKKKIWGITNG